MMAASKCIHLEVTPDADGKVRVRKNYAYKCSYPVPEYPLPASITRYYDFKWPPLKSQVLVDEHCAKCPCFAAKPEEPSGWLF
jgi:hypothetical protein